MPQTYISRGTDKRKLAVSDIFNADNGAGATIDDCILLESRPIILHSAYILYTTETTGTVAAATAAIGVAVAGATVVAATALENSKAVGVKTAMTLLLTKLPANTPVIVRHTGIATTAAGQYRVVLEYSLAL